MPLAAEVTATASASAKVSFEKIQCPFDLNEVFSIQYSADGLKSVLQFILDHLNDYKIDLEAFLAMYKGDHDDLLTKLVSKLLQVDK